MKSRVFISHTTGEASLALELKNFLEQTFPGALTVFASTDVQDLTPGQQWLKRIEAALRETEVLLVLCSPFSLTRPWINFEVGFGWSRGLDILPICHSGQQKDELPHPFSDLQALQLEDSDFCHSIVEVFCKHLNAPEEPEIDLVRAHKRLEKARKSAGKHEASPHIITSPLERTRLINEDLKSLLASSRVAAETVWTSAFLSTLAIGPDDPYPDDEQEHLKLLLQERDLLLKLARKGCTIKCIISPANTNHIRHAGIEYAIKRTDRLMSLLQSSSRALDCIDWAISELGVKNLYIIGHISCYEGYKAGHHRGYGLTLRQTTPDVIGANISLHKGFFRDLALHTLRRFGLDTDVGSEHDQLRIAAIRALQESSRFLADLSKGQPGQ